MKYLLSSIAILFLFSSFSFGTREGTLICKSESGRTWFNAKLENGELLESAEFAIDDAKSSFTQNDRSYVVFDLADHVYTIWIEEKTGKPGGGRFVKFWAIPSSFRTILKGSGPLPHEVYEFKAKIFGREPRTGFELNSKEIELYCTIELK